MRLLDIEAIQRILPHRYPFLLVDRLLELEPGRRGVGIKNVTINEPFFSGHFPGKPVMPGVMIVEAMAQVAGLVALAARASEDMIPYFVGINRARFRRPVVPGDQLRIEAEIVRVQGDMGRAECNAFVDGKLVADGEFIFALVRRNEGQVREGR